MTDAASALSSTPAPRSQNDVARTSLSDNFDTFLTLLTAQLRNQDPLSPVDSNQFTQQLVQYSQVEQQIRTNEMLEKLSAGSELMATNAALSYMGRTVGVVADRAELGAEGSALWQYILPDGAVDATLILRDAAGKEVLRRPVSPTPGEHAFSWDGKLNDGGRAAEGVYRLQVFAKMPDERSVPAEIRTAETVLGVELGGDDGPVLLTKFGERSLDAITSVFPN